MKRISALLMILVISSVYLVGCETTKGVGRDIENAGEELEDSVD